MGTYSWYADGKWPDPSGCEYFDSENPYIGETRAQISPSDEKDADMAVQAAWRAGNLVSVLRPAHPT